MGNPEIALPALRSMPSLSIDQQRLSEFGQAWNDGDEGLTRSRPHSSIQLGNFFDSAVAEALAEMLGDIPVKDAKRYSLLPPEDEDDCVEVGEVRVVGGVRPQSFDVGYRPDGARIAYDSKTLNDTDSVSKNWQNMVNDLGTEATTVHSRFPFGIVAFLVAFPEPTVDQNKRETVIETLERLSGRESVSEPPHMAEAISFVLWDPDDGSIVPDSPPSDSSLRIEKFSEQVEKVYRDRYKGLPPHRGR